MPHFLCLCLFLGLSACYSRLHTAESWVEKTDFKRVIFTTNTMRLFGYKKIQQRNKKIRIYIEGDGLAWISSRQPAFDPTPKNPQGLRLALLETTENVLYLARPCHYIRDLQACQQSYWTNGRFSPKVIQAYQGVLNQLKNQYHPPYFEIIGFSGGAQIAGLLAAKRQDVGFFVSVAGNLDHVIWTNVQGLTPLEDSENLIDYVEILKTIPQIHFIGETDKIVPKTVFQSYQNAIHSHLAKFIVLKAQGHSNWEKHWPKLLQKYL